MVIEVPVGQLAAPGRIDWTRVRLLREDGGEVPFSIREGRVHWRARLIAPIALPRAEDLLVFSTAPPRNTWSRLRLVAGPRHNRPALMEMSLWPYQGHALVFGDRRVIEFRGRAPRQAGEIRLRISLRTPYQGAPAFGEKEITLRWKC